MSIGIVVSGHYNFATGLQSAVEGITGKQEQCEFVDFPPEFSPEDLYQALVAAGKKVDSGEGVVFLVDLFGGTPANTAIRLLMENPEWECVCGANLSMAITAVCERDEFDRAELVATLQEPAVLNVQSLRNCLSTPAACEEADDGI